MLNLALTILGAIILACLIFVASVYCLLAFAFCLAYIIAIAGTAVATVLQFVRNLRSKP